VANKKCKDNKKCKGCEFVGGNGKGGQWCHMARESVRKMGDFCPKEASMEEIRKNCADYIPPEIMGDKASCCTAHLDSGRAFPCGLKRRRQLLKHQDFRFQRARA